VSSDLRHTFGMVEAVGIEPTSESLRQQNLHAYPDSFLIMNKQPNPANKLVHDSLRTILDNSLKEPKLPKIPRNRRLNSPCGRSKRDGCGCYAARANCSLAVIGFATVLRGCGTSACIY